VALIAQVLSSGSALAQPAQAKLALAAALAAHAARAIHRAPRRQRAPNSALAPCRPAAREAISGVVNQDLRRILIGVPASALGVSPRCGLAHHAIGQP